MDTNICESGFIFSLYNDTELYHEYISKIDAQKDFEKEESIFYFTVGREIVKQGYKTIDQLAIATYLQDKPNLKAYYESLGGWMTIVDLMSIVTESNVDKYYDELVKHNVFKKLKAKGFEVDEDKFKNVSSQEVYAYYEKVLDDSFIHNDSNIKIEVFDIDDEYLKRKHDGVGMGASIGMFAPRLNYEISGLHRGNLSIFGAYTGMGKAQPLDCKVLTKQGFKNMGDMFVGEEVFGQDGKLHKVIGVFPQGVKEVYRVTFSDGSSTKCCKEHLWNIQTANNRGRFPDVYETKSLEEIMKIPTFITDCYGRDKKNIYIPMTQPIEFEEKSVPLDAYLLGLLIGDGGFTNTQVYFTNSEEDIMKCVKNSLPKDISGNYNSISTIRLTDNNKVNKNNRFNLILEQLGLLKLYSNEKFIPDIYKYNSIKIRTDILSGLIDTDGEVNGSNYTFSSTSERLIDDVVFLVQSLGGTANKASRQTYFTYKGENKKGLPSFRVGIKMPIDIQIFKSEKHKAKFKLGQTKARRAIESVEYVGEEICQCIKVDNHTELYLTDNFIVTHNTSWMLHTIVQPLLEQGYNYTIISNEMVLDEFRDTMIVMVMAKKFNYYGITRKRLKSGSFSEEEFKQIHLAQEYINTNYSDKLKFVKMFEYDIAATKKIIRKLANEGCAYFMYDTFKATDAGDKNSTGLMIEYSKELFQLASKLNIHIFMTQQLAIYTNNTRYLNKSCLSNSKQVSEVADVIILMRQVWDDEINEATYDVKPYNFMKDEKGHYVKDSEGKTLKEYFTVNEEDKNMLVFLDKNRHGEDNINYITKFNGRFNIWNELGFVHVYTKNRF